MDLSQSLLSVFSVCKSKIKKENADLWWTP